MRQTIFIVEPLHTAIHVKQVNDQNVLQTSHNQIPVASLKRVVLINQSWTILSDPFSFKEILPTNRLRSSTSVYAALTIVTSKKIPRTTPFKIVDDSDTPVSPTFTTLNRPFTTVNESFTTLNGPFTPFNGPFTTVNEPFTPLNIAFTIVNKPLTSVNDSSATVSAQFTTLNDLLSIVLPPARAT